MSNRISAPQPSVVHLVTLFRQIANGELKIPAFQREYVWTEKQILGLLDSVYESYPIGSLLLWRVDRKVLDVAPGTFTAFPDVPEIFPLSYVLDGMQRLTTLFGAFNYSKGNSIEKLNVGYDLREMKFHHLESSQQKEHISVPLSSLFVPKKLLDLQSELALEPDGDILLDTVLKLQAAFQEYMIPTVTIQSTDVDRVVGIFERVNSTGTRLNSVDFMRAITWSSTFDLSEKLNEATAALNEFNWPLDSDTIVKCVAIMMNLNISSESLVQLRNQDEAKLHKAFDALPDVVKATADFLHSHFGIRSPEVVSYQGQILLAFSLMHQGKLEKLSEQFERWFWACGLNEQLQGKPDTYVSRLLADWSNLRQSSYISAPAQVSFSERDFLVRPVRSGAALTNSFRMLLARNKAKDLKTGAEIPSFEYLSSNSTSQFISALSKAEVYDVLKHPVTSSKLFSNSVLTSLDHEASDLHAKNLIVDALEAGRLEALASQFISRDAAAALASDDHLSFLSKRSASIFEYCQGVLG
ncbi:DUF262 domain-containing protein [Rhodobacter capsulatus]|uniref:DUF262 domain-containing protein n=1 Tax=Rhodobacter capsulatus TaxID=1061 RepID=UPI0040293A53